MRPPRSGEETAIISVVVLAGGPSSRMSRGPKALIQLCGRPMISYVLDVARSLSGDVVVVAGSEEQARALEGAVGDARLIVDEPGLGPKCPLLGLITGLKAVKGDVALALACDMPLVSAKVLSFLAEVLSYMNATVPRWPNGYVEPLHAAYRVSAALRAGEELLRAGGPVDMRSFLSTLGRVRYISTEVLKELDPALATLMNVNTPTDLRRAEMALRARGLCAGRRKGR